MIKVYDKEEILRKAETKNVIIHIGIMLCITAFFIVYFKEVQQNLVLQQQIQQHIELIPIGQLLAYEGYFGYVIIKIIRKWQENIKLKVTLSNVSKASVKIFHEYATWMIDFIGITLITFGFFIYGYPEINVSRPVGITNFSDLVVLTIIPGLAILSHLLLSRLKIEKR